MRLLASILILSAAPLLASTAFAATLTLTSDKSTYLTGETITLSIVGDSEGGAANVVEGYLTFDEQRVSWISTVQEPLASLGGSVIWVLGAVATNCNGGTDGPPGCPAFSQLAPIPGATLEVDNLLLVTMTLSAVAPGLVDFAWLPSDAPSWPLSFFGLTDAPGASITIVPEPATSVLLALGLLGLGARRRSGRA